MTGAHNREETKMSSYIAQDEEQRTRLADVLRRQRAERTDNDMLQRLQREQRLQRIDQQISELAEMAASTDHPKLKAMLSSALTKLGAVREQIA
jgi:hypothetical protein